MLRVVQHEDQNRDVDGFVSKGQPLAIEAAKARNPVGGGNDVATERDRLVFFLEDFDRVEDGRGAARGMTQS